MPGKAAKVIVTERQQMILCEIARARTSEVRLAQRAQIILSAFDKLNNEEIAEQVHLNPDQVGRWRRRWQEGFDKLVAIECQEGFDALRKAVKKILCDLPRSGRKPRISSAAQAHIVSMACEQPEESGRPISRWTSRELADEAIRRGVVLRISSRWVRKILDRLSLKPQRNKYWLFSKDRKDPEFDVRVQAVCDAYLESIDLYKRYGIHTVCIDEQTGIQALERIAPDLPARPGFIPRREYEYVRHGTIGLFGNFHVPTGRVLAPMLRETRTEEDFMENLDDVIGTDAAGTWRLIVDNLNTHCSESCVRYVAYACGIQEDLGVKGRSGILKSMDSRRKFLSDASHRIRFLFLPRHTSWLNQIEIWFGTLRRKVTRLGSFVSVDALCNNILEFIDYYNTSLAHPYNWTYTGRVVCK